MKQFWHKLVNRLRASKGESIVETLAAVLICSLAILMLYTAVASASRMNYAADAAAAEARQATYEAEAQTPTGDYREVTVDGFTDTFPVEYYTSANGSAVAYRYAQEVDKWPV